MRLAAALFVITALLVPSAQADTGVVTDRRDFTGPLDIVRATHAHAGSAPDGATRLIHRITTKRAWSKRAIRCRFNGCEGYFTINFDIDGDGRYERALYLFSRRGRLRAEMFKHGPKHECQLPRVACGHQRFVGRVGVWKPNGRTIVARFRLSTLRTGLSSFGWRTEATIGLVDRCRGDEARFLAPSGMRCTDRAPRRRFVQHRL